MKKKVKIGYAVFYGILFLAVLCRAFFSVELTDEIHGIASIYNIYMGKKPFMTSWDYHTGWCLLTPLFSLFHSVSPDFEGIVLFFRIFYLLFTVLSAGIISWMMARKRQSTYVWYFVFPSICFVPFSIFQISYNSLTIYLLMLAETILITSEKEKKERVRYFCLGILMGLGCISYPTLAIMSIGLIFVIVAKNRNGNWGDKIIFYMLGGGITAFLFFLWIFLDGNFTLFLEAVKGIFSSPHEKSRGVIDCQFLVQTFWVPLKRYFNSIFGICSAMYLAIQLIFKICVKKELWSWSLFIGFLFLNAWVNKGTPGYTSMGMLIASIPIFFRDKKLLEKNKEILEILFGYILTYSFTSDNRSMMPAFEIAGPFICLYIGNILWEIKQENIEKEIFCMLILGVTGILNSYTYVYRDEAIQFLDQRVESGIYKGLYTTESRKQMVEQVEKEIRSVVRNDETICAVTRAPMIYLMAKAEICAPQTWDAQFLYRGNISAEPLLSYFRAIDQIPDVLVATSLDIPDFINQEQYEIQEFIEEYYFLYYDNQIEGMDIWVWKRKSFI